MSIWFILAIAVLIAYSIYAYIKLDSLIAENVKLRQELKDISRRTSLSDECTGFAEFLLSLVKKDEPTNNIRPYVSQFVTMLLRDMYLDRVKHGNYDTYRLKMIIPILLLLKSNLTILRAPDILEVHITEVTRYFEILDEEVEEVGEGFWVDSAMEIKLLLAEFDRDIDTEFEF